MTFLTVFFLTGKQLYFDRMNNSANKAFRHFAGNRHLHSTSLTKLQTLASAYPYFPPAQFFLAKKLKDEQDEKYTAQSQKAVLYFYNPF